MKNYIYIFLAIVALSSCYHPQVIELSGEQATREFSFNPTCEGLSVFNTFDVILDESIPQGIAIIETDAAVMEHVKVKSHENNLSISLKGKWRVSTAEMLVRISPYGFKKFNATGACEIICEDSINLYDVELDATGASMIIFNDIKACKIEADATGSSTIILKGIADDVEFSATGASSIKAHKLECRDAEVRATGTSIISVNATEKLTGSNIGVSTIHYVGSPLEISVQNVGMSSIQRKVFTD